MKMNMHSRTQYYSNVDDAENSSCTVFPHLLWHCTGSKLYNLGQARKEKEGEVQFILSSFNKIVPKNTAKLINYFKIQEFFKILAEFFLKHV